MMNVSLSCKIIHCLIISLSMRVESELMLHERKRCVECSMCEKVILNLFEIDLEPSRSSST